jgi:hypothetical protein
MNRPEQPFKAMEPTGSVRLGYGTLAEKESSCAFPVMGNQWSPNNDITSRNRRVTDPYDRWCGGGGSIPPPTRFYQKLTHPI